MGVIKITLGFLVLPEASDFFTNSVPTDSTGRTPFGIVQSFNIEHNSSNTCGKISFHSMDPKSKPDPRPAGEILARLAS